MEKFSLYVLFYLPDQCKSFYFFSLNFYIYNEMNIATSQICEALIKKHTQMIYSRFFTELALSKCGVKLTLSLLLCFLEFI